MIFIFFIDLDMLNCSVRAHIQSASSTGVLYEPWKYEVQPTMTTPSSVHRKIVRKLQPNRSQLQIPDFRSETLVLNSENLPNQKIVVSRELEGVE